MKLTVKGKDIDLGESLQDQVREILEKISHRYFRDPVDATVSFGRGAHHEFSAHISLHVGRGISGEANGAGRTAYEALFNAGEAVAKQLRRRKRKLRHHPRHDPEFTLDRTDRDEVDAAPDDLVIADGHATVVEQQVLSETVVDIPADEEMPRRRVAGRR